MLAFELKSFKEPAETLEVEITRVNIIQLAYYLTIFDKRREMKVGQKMVNVQTNQ